MASRQTDSTERKTPKRGRPRRDPSAEQGSPISIRLTEDERRFIDDAASLADASTSQFVRQAAMERARDVKNAQPTGPQLRQLADIVVAQLRDPNATVHYVRNDDPDQTVCTEEYDLTSQPVLGGEEFEVAVRHVDIAHIGYENLTSLRVALESCVTEFAKVLAERLAQPEAPTRNVKLTARFSLPSINDATEDTPNV